MSVTPADETYPCSVCNRPFRKATGVRGSFCSHRCYSIHRRRKDARDILNQLDRDHRFCGTCFRQTKTVDEPPGERWGLPDCLVGFEYATEHATEAETTVSVDEYGRERIVGHSGKGCECGNTAHYQSEPALQSRFAFETAHFLVDSVDTLHAEGKTDATVDTRRLTDALVAHLLPVEESPETPNWEIVLAAALRE